MAGESEWIGCDWITLLLAGRRCLHRISAAWAPGWEKHTLSHSHRLWSIGGQHLLVQCATTMGHSGKYLDAIPSHPDPPGWYYRHGNPIFACARISQAHRPYACGYREYAGTGSRWNYRLLLARSAPGLFAGDGVCAGDGR